MCLLLSTHKPWTLSRLPGISFIQVISEQGQSSPGKQGGKGFLNGFVRSGSGYNASTYEPHFIIEQFQLVHQFIKRKRFSINN